MATSRRERFWGLRSKAPRRRSRYLIHDRDPLFTQAFGSVLKGGGVGPVRLPSRSPNLNAYAERFVRSVKLECVAQVSPLGERHLRRVVGEYVEHDHFERNHQGLGNQLVIQRIDDDQDMGTIECQERAGGLLRYYRRAA